MARRIVALKKRAKARGIPALYVNDNFGRWKSDFKAVDAPGRRLVELLRPEADDYFVLKPKQSGFFWNSSFDPARISSGQNPHLNWGGRQ